MVVTLVVSSVDVKVETLDVSWVDVSVVLRADVLVVM